MNTKQITLLHSNDMHGDFLADHVDDKLTGGVSMLSGYLNKCRNEDPNVIYAIADKAPQTEGELKNIPGFGPLLFDKYGLDILKMTTSLCDE